MDTVNLQQSSQGHGLAPVEFHPLELSWSVRTNRAWVIAKRGSKGERSWGR